MYYKSRNMIVLSFIVGLFVFISSHTQLLAEPNLAKSQTLYVPVYSNIFTGNKKTTIRLSAILSICNTDMFNSISISKVEFYDEEGKLVKSLIENPFLLKPLASKHFFIAEHENTGGTGANYVVKWQAKKAVNPPIIESIMVGTNSSQGISFTSQGKVISELTK